MKRIEKLSLMGIILITLYLPLIQYQHMVSGQTDKEVIEYLEITSDTQLLELAEIKGWGGDGSEKKPVAITNYLFKGTKENPQIFQDLLNGLFYTYGGFSTFNLLLVNITLHVGLSNNDFTHSVLILNSSNVLVESNSWVSEYYPSNLFVYHSPIKIRMNIFSGSNDFCTDDLQSRPTPRVYTYDGGIEIYRNWFNTDLGCHPIQHIIVRTDNVNAMDVIISYNYFESSDLGLTSLSAGNLEIHNNDFHVGDFGILLSGTNPNIHHNNFFQSEIGIHGNQNYQSTRRFFASEFSYPEETNDFNLVAGSTLSIDSNYYSNWNGPDADNDGIVDEAFSIGDGQFDFSPQSKPNPGYYSDSSGSGGNLGVILWGLAFSLLVGGLTLFTIFRNKAELFIDGELRGKTGKIIKELFKSQSILYYTIIGQNKIQDDKLEENIKQSIPRQIFDFKYLLHPVRFSITKLLFENLELTSIEIKDILEISWNDYYTHITSLKKKGFLKVEDKFIEGTRRQVLSLEPVGLDEYRAMTEILHLMLDNTTNYKAYIDAAQKRMDSIDRDLYPDG